MISMQLTIYWSKILRDIICDFVHLVTDVVRPVMGNFYEFSEIINSENSWWKHDIGNVSADLPISEICDLRQLHSK